jgi:vacuolar-type H+-ATPase subunit E/Vma4
MHLLKIEEVIENFFQKTVDYIDFIREPKQHTSDIVKINPLFIRVSDHQTIEWE